MNFKKAKKICRDFLRTNYSDERLAMLLAHAQSGKLAYNSCCCLVGVSTAKHALRSDWSMVRADHHGVTHGMLPGGKRVSDAYMRLKHDYLPLKPYHEEGGLDEYDPQRQRILIPMIRAEMKRRENLRHPNPQPPVFSGDPRGNVLKIQVPRWLHQRLGQRGDLRSN